MKLHFQENQQDPSYLSVVRELEARGTYPNRPPGIETTELALEKLGYTREVISKRFNELKNIVVVAGTNGKGSVCATLSTLLQNAGQTVGLFTSPHLISHTERIRLNFDPISTSEFVSLYEKISRETQEMRLTHFEMLTVMAYDYFHRSSATFAIFEVGLGGKWDATNAIPHRSCVVSRIGFDHQHLLGHKISLIAENKFGIIKQDCTAVCQPIDVTDETERQALSELKQRKITETDCNWIEPPACDVIRDANSDWVLESKWGRFPISLKGKRGAENINLALTAFETLGFSPSVNGNCLNSVNWPGRFDLIEIPNRKNVRFIFSADHNVQGFESLFEILTAEWNGRIHFVLGFGCEKDWSEILTLVQTYSRQTGRRDAFYLTETPFRGARLLDYGNWLFQAKGAHTDPFFTAELAYENAELGDTLIISGSVYLVGQIYSRLNELKKCIAEIDKVLTP